ncbi:MAG TPA: adenylate/guanylate cyclase domain-containing protein [Candidatus Adamsella sp.]|nr:adenylate/guanylate cyclase domain-containing protein [Candidatus Adamsella sp.]
MKKYSNNFHKFIIFIIITMLCIITYFTNQYFVEPSVHDLFSRMNLSNTPSSQIINIAIDENSLSKVGRWPWNRNLYGNIFEYVKDAKVIVFDSVITSSDNIQSDKKFFSRLKKMDNLILGTFFCNKEQNSTINMTPFAVDIQNGKQMRLIEYQYYANLPEDLVKNAHSIGSVSTLPDNDGVIRKLSPIFRHNKTFYPSVGIKAAMKYKNINSLAYKNNTLLLGDITIPLDKTNSEVYLQWYKPSKQNVNFITHKTYSASDILDSYNKMKKGEKPPIPQEEFKDKIIIVGATAYALNDIKKTPIGVDYPGLEIQATFIDNIINNDFMKKTSLALNLIVLAVLVILTVQTAKQLPIIYSLLTLITIILGWFYIAKNIFFANGYIIDVITPLSFVLLAYSLTFVYKYFLAGRSRNNLKNVMSKYISKSVMKDVLKNETAELGGKRAYVSVLFADIRQFTSISEVYTPEEVSSLLNEYFSLIAPIIDKYNGTLNKFMGDAVMAIFGAPIEDENHAKNAVLCAEEILLEVKKLNYKWKISNKPEIRIGVAINTGYVFIGNIGSKDRMEFTVIGDSVNIASRIESLNRVYNTSFLISSSTYEKVKDIVNTIKIRDVSIKGRISSVTIHEVIEIKHDNQNN